MVVGAVCTVGCRGGYGRRVGRRRGHAALVVMAQCWGPLVGEVWVGMGGGRGIVEWVAFAGDGVGAIAGDVWQEA